jgi:hypothetical protein
LSAWQVQQSPDKLRLKALWQVTGAPNAGWEDPTLCLSQHLNDVEGRPLAVHDSVTERASHLTPGDLLVTWTELAPPAGEARQQAWLDLGVFGCWKRNYARLEDGGGSLHLGPFVVGAPAGASGVRPTHAAEAQLGDLARLIGYDLAVGANGEAEVILYWQNVNRFPRDYTVFVQVLGDQGLVAQHDGPPAGGRLPTSIWEQGEVVADKHAIRLPANLPPGEYRLIAGMYSLADMVRLPVSGVAARGDHLELGRLVQGEAGTAPRLAQ